MRTTACFGCFLLLSLSSFAQQNTKEPDFPTTEEIELVVTQAERAFEQYKLSVDAEATLPSVQKDKSALEKDRQVVGMSGKLIDGLKKKSDAFNGLGGLLLLTTLDDASRNAALCASGGMTDMTQEALSRLDAASLYRILAIAKTCSDVSLHLYTVSESVNALFVTFIEAQDTLSQQAVVALQGCSAILKDSAPKK
jgi:hypothetical protein